MNEWKCPKGIPSLFRFFQLLKHSLYYSLLPVPSNRNFSPTHSIKILSSQLYLTSQFSPVSISLLYTSLSFFRYTRDLSYFLLGLFTHSCQLHPSSKFHPRSIPTIFLTYRSRFIPITSPAWASQHPFCFDSQRKNRKLAYYLIYIYCVRSLRIWSDVIFSKFLVIFN